MNIPKEFSVNTKEYIQIQTKLNLYIARYGCTEVAKYLDTLPLRMLKRDGKYLGAYIAAVVSKEYKISRSELFEESSRHYLTEARQMICVLLERYLEIGRGDISAMFHRSRHFAKRLIGDFYDRQKENHPFDQKLLNRFHQLDLLISSYVDFKPKSQRK